MRLNSTASPELPRPADERVAAPPYQLGEFHRFEGGGRKYLYLVPSGAIFEPTRVASEILQLLRNGERTKEQMGYLVDSSSHYILGVGVPALVASTIVL